MRVPVRWPLVVLAAAYPAGVVLAHVIVWGADRLDAHIARITDLGGDDE